MRPYTPGRLGSCLRSDPAFDLVPVSLCGRHSNGHLNMPLLGGRGTGMFTKPPFRMQHTVKNVVLTGGRDVTSCEARVALACWRTVYVWADICIRCSLCGLLSRATTAWGSRTRTHASSTTAFDHPGKNSDLTWLCNEFYGASSCAQTSQGCLWLFPGANITRWHRDFDEDWQLFTGKTRNSIIIT